MQKSARVQIALPRSHIVSSQAKIGNFDCNLPRNMYDKQKPTKNESLFIDKSKFSSRISNSRIFNRYDKPNLNCTFGKSATIRSDFNWHSPKVIF